MSYPAHIEEAATQWLTKRFVADPGSLSLIVTKAQELVDELGGVLAPAHFERAYLTLVQDGIIPVCRETADSAAARQQIPSEIVDFIERATAVDLRRRYAKDREFKRHYDLYAADHQRKQGTGSALTVEEYRSMSAQQIIRAYRSDAAFKAGVDSLISRGLI
jgi:hypothetical protein